MTNQNLFLRNPQDAITDRAILKAVQIRSEQNRALFGRLVADHQSKTAAKLEEITPKK